MTCRAGAPHTVPSPHSHQGGFSSVCLPAWWPRGLPALVPTVPHLHQELHHLNTGNGAFPSDEPRPWPAHNGPVYAKIAPPAHPLRNPATDWRDTWRLFHFLHPSIHLVIQFSQYMWNPCHVPRTVLGHGGRVESRTFVCWAQLQWVTWERSK